MLYHGKRCITKLLQGTVSCTPTLCILTHTLSPCTTVQSASAARYSAGLHTQESCTTINSTPHCNTRWKRQGLGLQEQLCCAHIPTGSRLCSTQHKTSSGKWQHCFVSSLVLGTQNCHPQASGPQKQCTEPMKGTCVLHVCKTT